jgi:hypothetical protein
MNTKDMEAHRVIEDVVGRFAGLEGLEAIVLGGSRATGTHVASSDIDIGLYYRVERPIDLKALGQVAAELDDEQRADLLTAFGGWGPWINGGGWLQTTEDSAGSLDPARDPTPRSARAPPRCHTPPCNDRSSFTYALSRASALIRAPRRRRTRGLAACSAAATALDAGPSTQLCRSPSPILLTDGW